MNKLLSIAASAVIASTAAFAADMESCATINTDSGTAYSLCKTDGMGDYSVIPTYFANENGWSTTVRVANTDANNAVVAKIVFREGQTSEEKLDFLLFLSPNDVWEGVVSYENGSVKISSTDDSTVFDGVVTSANNPLDTNFFADTGVEDSKEGYIEVFGLAKINPTDIVAMSTDDNLKSWVVNTPLEKEYIYKAYVNRGVAETSYTDVDKDLYTTAFVNSSSSKLSINIPTTNFNGFATEGFYQAPARDTVLDIMTNIINSDSDKRNFLNALDSLIEKSVINVDYSGGDSVNETVLYLTTPTKKYWATLDGLAGVYNNSSFIYPESADSAYYYLSTHYAENTINGVSFNSTVQSLREFCYTYTLAPYDMSENTYTAPSTEFSGGTVKSEAKVLCPELSKVIISDDSSVRSFKNGVARVNLANPTPVLPVVVGVTAVNGENITSASTPKSN